MSFHAVSALSAKVYFIVQGFSFLYRIQTILAFLVWRSVKRFGLVRSAVRRDNCKGCSLTLREICERILLLIIDEMIKTRRLLKRLHRIEKWCNFINQFKFEGYNSKKVVAKKWSPLLDKCSFIFSPRELTAGVGDDVAYSEAEKYVGEHVLIVECKWNDLANTIIQVLIYSRTSSDSKVGFEILKLWSYKVGLQNIIWLQRTWKWLIYVKVDMFWCKLRFKTGLWNFEASK